MCCSRANLACSGFTRAALEIRSSLWYFLWRGADFPVPFTASEKADVAASYSVARRVVSSQRTLAPQTIRISLATCDGARKLQRPWPPRILFHRNVVLYVTATVFSQLSMNRLSATSRGESNQ
jgi:hypothetical protein